VAAAPAAKTARRLMEGGCMLKLLDL